MFTFNFGVSKDHQAKEPEDELAIINVPPCAEVTPLNHPSLDWDSFSSKIMIGDIEITVVDSKKVVAQLKTVQNESLSALQADENHSDLVPGVYEGGMKIWECTHDLGDYLARTPSLQNLDGKSVLDLGCGAGILGILALKLGAECVHFQDYNSEVLTYLTIPNVTLNGTGLERCMFWSGDWKSYEETDDAQFDIILTSETIYNPSTHRKLLSVLISKLKFGGTIYVAGKSYYFGVGGSMKQFKDVCDSENTLSVYSAWTSNEGVKREILTLKRKSDR